MDTTVKPPNMADQQGRWRPAYMTDGEIAAELAAGPDSARRAELVNHARERKEGRRRSRAAAVAAARRS